MVAQNLAWMWIRWEESYLKRLHTSRQHADILKEAVDQEAAVTNHASMPIVNVHDLDGGNDDVGVDEKNELHKMLLDLLK